MVNLTRIYTRTGDDGTTSLGDFSRTRKTDSRLQAYADANEANASLGIAVACGGLRADVIRTLTRIQNDLFDVGADLCNPLRPRYDYPPLRVQAAWIDELEADCDRYNAELKKLRSFILPGGSAGSAYLHLACTIVRRAERSTWAALDRYGDAPSDPDVSDSASGALASGTPGSGEPATDRRSIGGINPLTATYLNRLSDLLFILARVSNLDVGGDVLWEPGGGRSATGEPASTPPAQADAGDTD
ncbi:MAG TPA: cob(I)yrinic acid a,c-diamide adenosyltransferase [Dermatophilaceae bacterium]|nr:cob(I)yrinic acid a,c-diamide adenosyltransferase [Dermatophilaceae bacterium]